MTREKSKPYPKSIITFNSSDLLMLMQVPKSRILKLRKVPDSQVNSLQFAIRNN